MPLQIKQFYTAPTLIRSLMAAGEGYVKAHDRSSLRVLGTVGEPINPEAWRWYHEARAGHFGCMYDPARSARYRSPTDLEPRRLLRPGPVHKKCHLRF